MNIVAHNIIAMNAQRQLGITEKKIGKSTKNLSSGYKINQASDNAAGLAISEKMRKQIKGLTRGVQNTEEGVSMCQVADGALAEVLDMLQRANELSVQSANGTNSDSDREAIDMEVSGILKEIDRIGDTTKFNDIKLFEGLGKKIVDDWSVDQRENGMIEVPNFSFDQITLDCELEEGPFYNGASGNTLKLAAKADNENGISTSWNLIYGSGSTSNSSIKGNYVKTDGTIENFMVSLRSITPENYTVSEDADGKTWSRDFHITDDNNLDLTITQSVKLNPKEENYQYYDISYDIVNNSGVDVHFDMMHHEDTAYSNNDRAEKYFTDNTGKVEKTVLYSTNVEYNTLTTASGSNVVPDNFSIVNTQRALCFTENIKIGSSMGSADTVCFGQYSIIDDWNYYSTSGISSILDQSTNGMDMGFSLIWSGRDLTSGGSTKFQFQQGVISLETDVNIPSDVEVADTIEIPYDPKQINVGKQITYGEKELWIQAGNESKQGIMLQMGAMNTSVLAIDDISLLTVDGADDAIDKISDAISLLSRQRSRIGAYQNRLEHAIKNEDNVVENTTAAESQIRDTDMAEEMVAYSNANILQQAGQSMLAQANQSNQGVLSLLQG